MDTLWAPWRIKYITEKKRKVCIFCAAAKSNEKDYVIFTTKHCVALLNIHPYNNGHIMISPLRHVADISLLTEDEAQDIFRSLKITQKILAKVLKPQGYNIGINQGSIAGAGIPGHLHLHVVPRWLGDTNCMPVVFATKIISQSLKELQKRLINAYAKTN